MIEVILVPALKIVGIAAASEVISRVMEDRGHSGKIIFVKIIAQVGCAYVAYDLLITALKHFAHLLGV